MPNWEDLDETFVFQKIAQIMLPQFAQVNEPVRLLMIRMFKNIKEGIEENDPGYIER